MVSVIKSEQDKLSEQKSNQVFYRNNQESQYVMPHINKSPEPYVLQHRSMVPLINHPGRPIGAVGVVHPNPIGLVNLPSLDCPCAAQVRCKPCGIVASPVEPNIFAITPAECPCAPKLNCPVCPPLSLLHEIASKKVYNYNVN